MKVLVAIGLVSRVAGFAPVVAPAATTALNAEMSKALPFLMQPKGLTGYVGAEAGFDPLGFAEIMSPSASREFPRARPDRAPPQGHQVDARGRDQARPRGHARDDRLHVPRGAVGGPGVPRRGLQPR